MLSHNAPDKEERLFASQRGNRNRYVRRGSAPGNIGRKKCDRIEQARFWTGLAYQILTRFSGLT